MNKFAQSVAAVLLCGAVAFQSPAVFAQAKADAAAAASPHKVALIDMAFVFKNYKKFDALREDLKQDITESEERAKLMVEKLQAVQKEMREFKEGSDEFAQREKTLAKMQAEFETFRRGAQRDMLKKESQLYHTVYLEITDAVKKYAEFYKYTLVIRFNREELDSENPQNLLQGMNRQVVYHRTDDDITQKILDFLNSKYQPAAPAASPAAPVREATKGRPAAK